MGSRERGDYISHGYLENYLAPIAFVPFLQVVVVGVVVEHRDKLVEAMRMAGLKPVSYWSATFIFEALITGFWSAFLVACGIARGRVAAVGAAADDGADADADAPPDRVDVFLTPCADDAVTFL